MKSKEFGGSVVTSGKVWVPEVAESGTGVVMRPNVGASYCVPVRVCACGGRRGGDGVVVAVRGVLLVTRQACRVPAATWRLVHRSSVQQQP